MPLQVDPWMVVPLLQTAAEHIPTSGEICVPLIAVYAASVAVVGVTGLLARQREAAYRELIEVYKELADKRETG